RRYCRAQRPETTFHQDLLADACAVAADLGPVRVKSGAHSSSFGEPIGSTSTGGALTLFIRAALMHASPTQACACPDKRSCHLFPEPDHPNDTSAPAAVVGTGGITDLPVPTRNVPSI